MEKFELNIPRVITFVKVNITKLNNTLHAQYHRTGFSVSAVIMDCAWAHIRSMGWSAEIM